MTQIYLCNSHVHSQKQDVYSFTFDNESIGFLKHVTLRRQLETRLESETILLRTEVNVIHDWNKAHHRHFTEIVKVLMSS